MQGAPPSTSLIEEAGAPHNASSRRVPITIATAVVVTLTIGTIALLVLPNNQDPAPAGPAAPPSPTVAGMVTTTPTASEPSALEALAPFLSAAATLDGQLEDAAAAINAAGPPWTYASPEVARLVKAADLSPVARAIPAGLPPDLRQSVILVYSELSSRRHAMASFEITPPAEPHATGEVLLSELSNGHVAAARFDADLTATRSVAAATPRVAAVPADSRLVAEALLLVQYVEKGNGGGDARGGAVISEPLKIRWGSVSWNPDADGTIGRPGSVIDFTAEFRDGTWEVEIIAS